MALTPKRIDLVVLFVADLERAKAFYQDTLGFALTFENLVAKGVEFARVPADRARGMHTAHFRDPDGSIWEIARSLREESNDG